MSHVQWRPRWVLIRRSGKPVLGHLVDIQKWFWTDGCFTDMIWTSPWRYMFAGEPRSDRERFEVKSVFLQLFSTGSNLFFFFIFCGRKLYQVSYWAVIVLHANAPRAPRVLDSLSASRCWRSAPNTFEMKNNCEQKSSQRHLCLFFVIIIVHLDELRN